jgi:6-pyruvoyltetrahydropterin/6-carboxytetrahydropterin synthase
MNDCDAALREKKCKTHPSHGEHRFSSIEYQQNMFTISVESRFKASHQLILPDGSQEPAHEHGWLVIVNVSRGKLNRVGVVMDFLQLKAVVNDILAELDNVPLGNVAYFRRNNPSAENVAKYIYERLKPKLSKKLKLQAVTVVEEPGYSAKFCQ